MTLEEQLDSVQRAIARIEENGQETDIEVGEHRNRSRTVRGRVKDLYERESKLKMAISRKRGGGMIDAIPY